MRVREILAGLFLAASLGGTPGEGATLHLSVPSEGECLLAATRDLYVLGTLDRQGRSPSQEPLDLRVRLFRLGEAAALRTVTASVDATGLTPRGAVRVDYLKDLAARKLGNLYAPSDDPVLRCPPPDLLGDPSVPGSLEDPRNKGVVTEHTFAALLQGGVTGDFDTAYRRVLSRDLEEGTYRLLVEALDRSGSVAASADRILRLGTVPDKVLARFSPPEHLAAVTAFAAARGYRIYRDPFPGYWDCGSPSSPEPLRGEAPYFAEILPRWRANDALEYRGGRVHGVIYNISPGSTSQAVEIGSLAATGRLETAFIPYHYDIGEVALSADRGDGVPVRRVGVLVPFASGDRLVLTRAEIRGDGITPLPESDGICSPDETVPRVDWTVSDGVQARARQMVSLFGVVPPIQPASGDVRALPDGSYGVDNRIAVLRTRVFDGDRLVLSRDLAIGLVRLRGGRVLPSLYEFRKDLSLPVSLDGRVLQVRLEGLDARGNRVAGTEESFPLRVGDRGSGGCDVGTSSPLLGLLLAGGLLRRRRKARRTP